MNAFTFTQHHLGCFVIFIIRTNTLYKLTCALFNEIELNLLIRKMHPQRF